VSAVECYGTNSVGLGLVISSTNAASQLYFTSILHKKKKKKTPRESLSSFIALLNFFFFFFSFFFNSTCQIFLMVLINGHFRQNNSNLLTLFHVITPSIWVHNYNYSNGLCREK